MKGAARPTGVLSPADFEERLAAAPGPPPVVAAAGPDSFLRDAVIGAAVAKALGDPASPDAVVLHGPAKAGEPDAPTLAGVLEDVRTPSLFAAAGTKVVVLRRADALLGAEGEALAAYLERPAAGALLVLATEAGPADRGAPAKVRAALEGVAARGAVVSCEPPSAEAGRGGSASPLALWTASRARSRGKRLDPGDAEFLVLRGGTALATLDATVAAAALHAGDAPAIALADLEAVAPRGPSEGSDRFVEAMLAGDAPGALRVLAGLYREGVAPWGAKSPVRGEGPVTLLLVNQVRRMARDVRKALDGGGGFLPPSLRFGCRDPRKVLRRSDAGGIGRLLAALTDLESSLKSGTSGGERARFEALVVGHAGAA